MKPLSLYSTAVQCNVRCTFNVHNPLDSGVKRKSVNFKTHRTCRTCKCTRPQRTAAAQATRTVCQSVDSHCRPLVGRSVGLGSDIKLSRSACTHALHERQVPPHVTSRHVMSRVRTVTVMARCHCHGHGRTSHCSENSGPVILMTDNARVRCCR